MSKFGLAFALGRLVVLVMLHVQSFHRSEPYLNLTVPLTLNLNIARKHE